jgi:hypothetical protein
MNDKIEILFEFDKDGRFAELKRLLRELLSEATRDDKLEKQIYERHAELFPGYVYNDSETTVDLLAAEIIRRRNDFQRLRNYNDNFRRTAQNYVDLLEMATASVGVNQKLRTARDSYFEAQRTA